MLSELVVPDAAFTATPLRSNLPLPCKMISDRQLVVFWMLSVISRQVPLVLLLTELRCKADNYLH